MSSAYMSVPGLIASASLASHQYHVVSYTGTLRNVQEVADADDTTEHPAGILQNDPDTAGHAADVAFMGICKAELGGTVNPGDWLGYNDDGELIEDAANPANQTNANNLYHLAQALEDGVDGDIIDVMVFPAALRGIE